MLSENEMLRIHEFSSGNMDEFDENKKCGCFYCCRIFESDEIEQYITDEDGDTAVCPYCSIDSVLGEGHGFKITDELLKEMHDFWF